MKDKKIIDTKKWKDKMSPSSGIERHVQSYKIKNICI